MDVLELPRPVINFLRTMAKEGSRYTLSWDIFGGSDSVTLTLTWKVIDDPISMKNEILLPSSHTPIYDDLPLQMRDSTASVSPRRSRRTTKSTLTQGHTSSLERNVTQSDVPLSKRNQQRPSFSNQASLSLSLDRTSARSLTPRKNGPSILNMNNRSPPLRRMNVMVSREDDDGENPWVKRLESSPDTTIDRSSRKGDCVEISQGKVKFKSKPDYF